MIQQGDECVLPVLYYGNKFIRTFLKYTENGEYAIFDKLKQEPFEPKQHYLLMPKRNFDSYFLENEKRMVGSIGLAMISISDLEPDFMETYTIVDIWRSEYYITF